ncbi:MAG: hypothetical protein AMXMBFR58_29810 [Phycisphaerae bacterium]
MNDGRSVEIIRDLAQNARHVTFVRQEAEASDVYYVCESGKPPARTLALPKPRSYTAFRVDDVVAMVGHFAAENENTKFVVLCGRGNIRVVFDEAESRRGRVSLGVPFSRQYKLLKEMEAKREELSQKDLVQLLRVEFADAVDSDFIALMRQMKFTDNRAGEGSLSAGKESLGSSVYREAVFGGKACPEEVEFTVPVYEDLIGAAGDQYVHKISAVVDVDVAEQVIRIIPRPADLLAAVRCADAWLSRQLQPLESRPNVRVFCGSE